ncbi:hypothetical protein MKX40_22280 [Paenibacillus sp. FSL R5-0517]|uniref:hypothetical protein n=1 Tax=Paenibacillus sp. FSL R5-0517 TaxID=2921647 RepID=UPI0030DB9A78
MEKIMFAGDIFEYTEFEDGSKLLYTKKNSRGFEITLRISGDPEEHEIAHQALKNFFVKGGL